MRFLVMRIRQRPGRVRILEGRVLDADAHVGCEGVLILKGTSRVFRCRTHPDSPLLWIPASHGDVDEILENLLVPAKYHPAFSAEEVSRA